MSEGGKYSFESFLKHISLTFLVNFHIQNRLGSSSSGRTKARQVGKPQIVLSEIWSAYREWSCYAVGVPITLRPNTFYYYAPTLSAIQIFTKKPFFDGSSTSRRFGEDCHLYFEYNETERLAARLPFTLKVEKLAEKHSGLESLTSSDLSQNSWFSISWSPVCQIPKVSTVNALPAYFLTYHSLTPIFTETFPQEAEVELPAFGVVASKLSDKVWIMPGTSDQENVNRHEESAASWLGKLMFSHSDFDMFMAEKSNDLPFPSWW